VELINLSEKEQMDAVNEARFLSKVSSPYVIGYFDSFADDSNLYIIMEFADKGTLDELVKKQRTNLKVAFEEREIWRYLLEITIGTYQIHFQKLIHRDLKTANIFLSGENSFELFFCNKLFLSVKIGDLGVARELGTASFAQTAVGSL
jgi:NIMA (never in mitosis gene a)-related kinase